MVRTGRLSGGIILLFFGLIFLGGSYYIKTSADTSFTDAQCGNIVGGIIGALYGPEVQACQKAQTFSTFSLIGEGVGVIMLVIGLVSICTSFGGGKQTSQMKLEQFTPKIQGPIIKFCKYCRKNVRWWQSALQQDNFLLHQECYEREMKKVGT
jgi:hypothetical protein